MITFGDILTIESRRQQGELKDVRSCPHALYRALSDLYALELDKPGDGLIAYLCCGACRVKCHELMGRKEEASS